MARVGMRLRSVLFPGDIVVDKSLIGFGRPIGSYVRPIWGPGGAGYELNGFEMEGSKGRWSICVGVAWTRGCKEFVVI